MHRFIVSFHFCPSRVPLSVIEGFSLGSYPFFLPLSHTRHAFYTLHSAFYCGLGSFIIIPHSFFCRLIRTIIIHCIFKLSTIVQSGRYGFKRCILHERFMDLSGITLDIFPRHAVKDIDSPFIPEAVKRPHITNIREAQIQIVYNFVYVITFYESQSKNSGVK